MNQFDLPARPEERPTDSIFSGAFYSECDKSAILHYGKFEWLYWALLLGAEAKTQPSSIQSDIRKMRIFNNKTSRENPCKGQMFVKSNI